MKKTQKWAAVAAAVIGVTISVMLWNLRSAWEAKLLNDAFQLEAAGLSQVIEREINLFLDTLDSLGRLHSLSLDVNQQAFGEFVQKGLVYHRTVLGVFGWAPRVLGDQRTLFEDAMRRAGQAGFRILEEARPGTESEENRGCVAAADRDEYFPVSYVAPADSIPIGFDLASNAGTTSAIQRARATGQAAMGGPVDAGLWTAWESSFARRSNATSAVLGHFRSEAGRDEASHMRLVLLPIVKSPPRAAGEVDGFAFAVLQPDELILRALSYSARKDLDVVVEDVTEEGPSGVLFAQSSKGPGAAGLVRFRATEPAHFQKDISFSGQTWRVRCASTPAFASAYQTGQPWILLWSGLLITALLSIHLWVLAGHAEKTERTVRERTAELSEAYEKISRESAERKRLTQEVLEIGSREKKRIGSDLHDSLGQHLTGIAFLAKTLTKKLEARTAPEAVEAGQLTEMVRDSIAQVRQISRGLSPVGVGEEGLASALMQLADDACGLFGIECRFRLLNPTPIQDERMAVNLYHIAQEAVTNAARHGKPKHIEIDLSSAGERGRLAVTDDGMGISPDAMGRSGMGLRIMRQRAEMIGGELTVSRGEKGGAVVECVFRVGEKI